MFGLIKKKFPGIINFHSNEYSQEFGLKKFL